MKLRKGQMAGVSLVAMCGFLMALPQVSLSQEEKKSPEAAAGQVEIKELKTTLAVDVLAQHSKVFKTKQKITRLAVSDANVADIVLMTENQFVVIGKTPGAISVTIWCKRQ